MERPITHLLLVPLGGTVLHVSLTDAHLAPRPARDEQLRTPGHVLVLIGRLRVGPRAVEDTADRAAEEEDGT